MLLPQSVAESYLQGMVILDDFCPLPPSAITLGQLILALKPIAFSSGLVPSRVTRCWNKKFGFIAYYLVSVFVLLLCGNI
jgi:hypothetical protein